MNTGPEEETIWQGNMSWRKIIFRVIGSIFLIFLGLPLITIEEDIAVCFGSILLLIGSIILIRAIVRKLRTEYVITNKRLYSKYGVVSRNVRQADITKLTDTSFTQTFFDRILGIGSVYVNTAGSNAPEIVFIGLKDPKYVIGIVENVKNRNKNLANIKQRVERIEDRYLTGEITKVQYESALKRLHGTSDVSNRYERDMSQQDVHRPTNKPSPPPTQPENYHQQDTTDDLRELDKRPTERKRKCPNCEKELDSDWLSCPYCGKKLAKRCPECDEVMPIPVHKCSSCGYEETIVCENCGREISKELIDNEGIKYCPECSSKISDIY